MAPMPVVSLGHKGISSHVTASAYANTDFIVLTIVSVAAFSPSVELTSITLPA